MDSLGFDRIIVHMLSFFSPQTHSQHTRLCQGVSGHKLTGVSSRTNAPLLHSGLRMQLATTSSNKKLQLLVTKGTATRSKDATSSSWPYY